VTAGDLLLVVTVDIILYEIFAHIAEEITKMLNIENVEDFERKVILRTFGFSWLSYMGMDAATGGGGAAVGAGAGAGAVGAPVPSGADAFCLCVQLGS